MELSDISTPNNQILVYDMSTKTLIPRGLEESDVGETVYHQIGVIKEYENLDTNLVPQDNDNLNFEEDADVQQVDIGIIEAYENLGRNLVHRDNDHFNFEKDDDLQENDYLANENNVENSNLDNENILYGNNCYSNKPNAANGNSVLLIESEDNIIIDVRKHNDVSVKDHLEDTGDQHIQLSVPEKNGENLGPNQITKKRRKFDTRLEERKRMKTEQMKISHSVKEIPCEKADGFCKKKCGQNIDRERRMYINKQFWDMIWIERRHFILTSCEKVDITRRRVKNNDEGRERRSLSIKYYLKDDNDVPYKVCKGFFLTTLGYKKTNDRFVHYTLTNTPKGVLTPLRDKRGKQPSTRKGPHDKIIQHIESFHPTISHYRREHAPNVRYLPSDINIVLMHNDFLEKFPEFKGSVSYDLYRRIVAEQHVSFAQLGHEECEKCEQFALHEHKKESLDPTCDNCQQWKIHNELVIEARITYKYFSNHEIPDDTICFSSDMQKIIMLPRVDMFKKVLFIKRLIAYHETFAPVGQKSKLKVHSMLWHEGVSGRNKEDNVSALYKFLKQHRDVDKIVIWMDNCSSQNKNWCMFTFLVYVINSSDIAASEIVLNYFQPGHSFMSADSFHHQVEQSLKIQRKTYDFEDFVTAVKKANSGNVEVFEMQHYDFFYWPTYMSQQKFKNTPRLYLSDIVHIKAVRGSNYLLCKTNYDVMSPYQQLDFLQKKAMKGIKLPPHHTTPCGFPEDKKNNILQSLNEVLPENRKQFWSDLPTPQPED